MKRSNLISALNCNKNKSVAFTLAEVLITLTVIGILAILTISILAETKKMQIATSAEKAYNTMSQVINRSEIDNGETSTWPFSTLTTTQAKTDFLNQYILPYLNLSKDCGFTTYNSSCVNSTKYWLDGLPIHNRSDYYVYLVDGACIKINLDTAGLYIDYDINGNQNPNKMGIDIFQMGFYLWYSKPYRFRFRGDTLPDSYFTGNHTYVGTCSKVAASESGNYCGAWIQRAGWKVPDNYPLD